MTTWDTVSKARARLTLDSPFFAALVMSLPLVETREIPTAATDMRKIYYNPDWFATMRIEQAMTVLAHEVWHVSSLHGLRAGGRDRELWNTACDHSTNIVLDEQGFQPPDGKWNFCDKKYVGWSTERIYDDLMQNGGGDGSSDGGSLGNDLLPSNGVTDAEAAEIVTEIRAKVAQAAQMAKMMDKLKGELARLVDEMLDSRIPWWDLMRDLMMRITKNDHSWQRANRRFDDYLPSLRSPKLGPIVVIGDTSGSMQQPELDRAGAEIRAVASQCMPECIRVLWADTDVASEQVFDEHDLVLLKPAGGGGTDMRVPLQYAEQFNPEVVILITDGYTPWPLDEPTFPLIVCCTTGVDVPVGSVVRLRD